MGVRTYITGHDTCPDTGKLVYVTKARACVFAKRIGRKNRKNGDSHPVHVYRCDSCGGFHIGHDPGWLKRRKGQRHAAQADGLWEWGMTTERNDEGRRMTTGKTKKPKTHKAHPWRAFNPGWLRDRPRQVPHWEVKKP